MQELLYRNIVQNKYCLTSRMVYCDWLREYGDRYQQQIADVIQYQLSQPVSFQEVAQPWDISFFQKNKLFCLFEEKVPKKYCRVCYAKLTDYRKGCWLCGILPQSWQNRVMILLMDNGQHSFSYRPPYEFLYRNGFVDEVFATIPVTPNGFRVVPVTKSNKNCSYSDVAKTLIQKTSARIIQKNSSNFGSDENIFVVQNDGKLITSS